MKLTIRKTLHLFVIITTLSITGAKAQEFKDKFFLSHGFSIYSEVYTRGDDFGISLFTYTCNLRYNLKEIDDNTSISLGVPVGVGLMGTESNGFGNLNIPLFISYNTGNISTYSADQNNGFTVGLGVEYYNVALFGSSDLPDGASDGTSFIEPCINIGFRYWNKKNVAREFNIKFGYGPSIESVSNDVTTDLGNALTFKLTWIRYPKY